MTPSKLEQRDTEAARRAMRRWIIDMDRRVRELEEYLLKVRK